MKFLVPLFATVTVLAVSFSDLPSFDWEAALFVGAVVAIAAVVVVVVAIATPAVMIQGTLTIGTIAAIGAIALATGAIGGTAAGFYWGRQGDIDHGKNLEEVASQSNQLHISFVPSASDSERAADFECNIVVYKEVDIDSRPPKVNEETLHVTGVSASEFYLLIEQKLEQWFGTPVLADQDEHPRTVTIYMAPSPGEGVYERLKDLVEDTATREVVVQRVDGTWKSAISEKMEE